MENVFNSKNNTFSVHFWSAASVRFYDYPSQIYPLMPGGNKKVTHA